MGYDEIIPVIGNFGRYQKRIYFLLCLPSILCAFHKLGNVFLIAEPNYRCQLPDELSNATYHLSDDKLNGSFPWDGAMKRYSSCTMYTPKNGSDYVVERCTRFIFDKDMYGYTAVVEWQLTCEKTYQVATGNAIFMAGVMVGSIVFGELSDRYGRKLIFFISLVIQVVFGLLAAFSPEFWTFTIARFMVGTTTSGVFLVAFVIAMEMVGVKDRLFAGTVSHMFFSVGYMLTAVFAIYLTNWRHLQLALTLPGVVFFCYWWFIPESTRWLLNKNRIEEAKQLIFKAAKSNNIKVTPEQIDNLLQDGEKTEQQQTIEGAPAKKATILDIFRHPNLRKRSLIIFFDWFANNITYYGLSWNTNNLAGDPYINFVISGAVELPGYTLMLLTLNRWGRKKIMCGCMIVAGCSLLLTIVIPENQQWLVVALAMFGKLVITASYGTVYIFSTEQFPTVIRNAGLGAGSMCARIGSVLCPYVNVLGRIWGPFPLIIFGSLSLIGGILSLTLPETLNKKLPETIEEGEAFDKKTPEKGTSDEEVALNQKTIENGNH